MVDINRIEDQEVEEKTLELGDFRYNCDITMKQIPMGNVNFWISPEKAVSKVRQCCIWSVSHCCVWYRVVNMSNVSTRNRKPRVSLDLQKLIIWAATIHSPSNAAKLVSYFLKYFSYDCCCSIIPCFMQSIIMESFSIVAYLDLF